MGQISLEGRLVNVSLNVLFGHLYLVYRNDAGQEYVINGGPNIDVTGSVDLIGTTAGSVLLSASGDTRGSLTAADRGAVPIDLGGRDAGEVWAIMSEQAANIAAARLPYFNNVSFQNSNSTVASVLHAVGITLPSDLPSDWTITYPGTGNLLTFNRVLDGTIHDDTIQGFTGDDKFTGGRGNDHINGGDGDDTAYFEGLRTEYTITTDAAGNTLVTHLARNEIDTLNSIEHIKFDSVTTLLGSAFVPVGNSQLARNDDGSSGLVNLSTVFKDGINFFGTNYTGLYVNNNGSVTFGSPLSQFTPNAIGGVSNLSIIAPFWADVDTRGIGQVVTYGLDPVRGDFTVTWANVDYYNATDTNHVSKFNSFQLELIDQGGGDVDILFRYQDINWTTGNASGGTNGLGGTPARAGFASGDGVHYFELPHSGNQAAVLNLENTSGNTGFPGVWQFTMKDGAILGIGTTGPDILNGDNRANFIDLAAGNDVGHGGGGNDTIIGGPGDDQVFGDDGDDILIAGSGQGNDAYDGGPGIDTIVFSSTTLGITVNLLTGIADGVEIDHDTIVNVENVVGGSGNDFFTGNAGPNSIDGGDGIDTVVIHDVYANSVWSVVNGALVLTTADGTDTLRNVEKLQFTDRLVNVADGGPPLTVSSVSVATDSPSRPLHAGHVITITIVTSAPTTVTGTPTLQLNDNEVASYTFGSGTNTLAFTYVTQTGDNVANLQITGLNLPSGANIADGGGNTLPLSITRDLGIQIDTTTVPPTSVQHEVLGLYSALYNRAADFAGLSYWIGLVGQQPDATGVTVSNAAATPITLSDATLLGQLFVTTQSTYFNSVYGSLTDIGFITALYANIGGNTIGIDPGVTYWNGLLHAAEAAGQSVQAARAGIVGQIVRAMVDYDINVRPPGYTDAEWLAAQHRQETIDNKIAVSLGFSNASQQPGGTILNAVSVTDAAFQASTRAIQGVTFDGTTASAAINNILYAVANQDLNEIQPVGIVSNVSLGLTV
jgi:hypothetical protein